MISLFCRWRRRAGSLARHSKSHQETHSVQDLLEVEEQIRAGTQQPIFLSAGVRLRVVVFFLQRSIDSEPFAASQSMAQASSADNSWLIS